MGFDMGDSLLGLLSANPEFIVLLFWMAIFGGFLGVLMADLFVFAISAFARLFKRHFMLEPIPHKKADYVEGPGNSGHY